MKYDDINKALDVLIYVLAALALGTIVFTMIMGLFPIIAGMLSPFISIGRLLFSVHPYIWAIVAQSILLAYVSNNGEFNNQFEFELKPAPIMIMLTTTLLALLSITEASASFMFIFLFYIFASITFGVFSKEVHLYNIAVFGLLSFLSVFEFLGIALPFALVAATPVCQALLLVTTLSMLFRMDSPTPLPDNADDAAKEAYEELEDRYARNYHIRTIIGIIETCAAVMSIFLGPVSALIAHSISMSLLQMIKTDDHLQGQYVKLTIITFVFDYLMVFTPLGKFQAIKTLATQVAPKARSAIDFICVYREYEKDAAALRALNEIQP